MTGFRRFRRFSKWYGWGVEVRQVRKGYFESNLYFSGLYAEGPKGKASGRRAHRAAGRGVIHGWSRKAI